MREPRQSPPARFALRAHERVAIPSTATVLPPFQGRDTRLRSLSVEVRVLSVVPRARKGALRFAGRWRLVTGLLIRGARKIAATRAPLLVRSYCSPCWCTVAAHTRARESSILSTATRRSLLLRNAGSRRGPSGTAIGASPIHCDIHRACWCTASTPNRMRRGSNPRRCASPAFMRAAVWQQSRWVMPSPKARLLSSARYQRATSGCSSRAERVPRADEAAGASPATQTKRARARTWQT